MDPIAPTTELEAINTMLEAIAVGPVETIVGDTSLDVVNAVRILRGTSRDVQRPGWWFNREIDYEIAPNVSGEIVLPSNTLGVTPNNDHFYLSLVQRGMRLYSRTNRTFNIAAPIKMTLILGLAFDDLPEEAKRYIATRAGRVLKNATEDADTPASVEESMAWVDLRKKDLLEDPMSMLNSYERNEAQRLRV